jgi:hypothetical protein
MRKSLKISNPANNPDKGGVTLWNIVRKYVKDNHQNVPIDSGNTVSGCYRFRVKVLKNEIEIADSGASPGMKAPEDFPRQIIQAADPDFFKKLSKVCKYRGKGGVCVYRNPIRTLKANWTVEAATDLMSLHGFDVEKTLVIELALAMQKEIDKAIIENLIPLDIGDVMSPKPKRKK